MIVLECKPTKTMLQLEVLKDHRLPIDHVRWNDINNDYHIKHKGHIGEKALKFYLDILPEGKYQIYFGIRLKYKNYFFQIDTLLTSSKFILVNEVKNMEENISFDRNFNQATFSKKGRIKRRQNPVLQAKLQAQKLKEWLAENGFPEVPIEYLFVNTNENTTLTTVDGNHQMTSRICNSECLIDKIEKHAQYHTEEKLDPKELRKLKKVLLEKHTPEDIDILEQYEIPGKDIITGVQCPKCGVIGMNYKNCKWNCTSCGKKSKDAHIAAINDYFLLYGPEITNAELRRFLQIDSSKVAYRILKSMKLTFEGNRKNRVYYAPGYTPPEKNHPNMHKTENLDKN